MFDNPTPRLCIPAGQRGRRRGGANPRPGRRGRPKILKKAGNRDGQWGFRPLKPARWLVWGQELSPALPAKPGNGTDFLDSVPRTRRAGQAGDRFAQNLSPDLPAKPEEGTDPPKSVPRPPLPPDQGTGGPAQAAGQRQSGRMPRPRPPGGNPGGRGYGSPARSPASRPRQKSKGSAAVFILPRTLLPNQPSRALAK